MVKIFKFSVSKYSRNAKAAGFEQTNVILGDNSNKAFNVAPRLALK